MTDEELATDIRKKARELCTALDAAGRAGLKIKITFENMFATFEGNHQKTTDEYRYDLSLCRETWL